MSWSFDGGTRRLSLKPLVGSCGSVRFVVREVSVFVAACVVGSSDMQTEQVAEWEMCVLLELYFFFFFVPGNLHYLPSQFESCVVRSFGDC